MQAINVEAATGLLATRYAPSGIKTAGWSERPTPQAADAGPLAPLGEDGLATATRAGRCQPPGAA